MSENKSERQISQQQPSQQVSPSSKEDEAIATGSEISPAPHTIPLHPLVLPPHFISTNLSPTTEPQQTKRPRFSPNPSTGQWKLVSPPSPHPQLSSSDTASSPSHSPVLPTSSDAAAATKAAEPNQAQFRKGKYVSPVWKPNEMLWLARAWRIQYQGGPGSPIAPLAAGASGRAKTRADKDREVADFLKAHGVNRDAKTAGTKWDNMLGEFRKVYEWERGGEREQIGKSYFRLSPYERKMHRLPASFDEEVFEELAQFMGSRIRTSSSSSAMSPSHARGLFRSSMPTAFLPSFGAADDQISAVRGSSFIKAAAPLPPLREDDSTSFSVRSRHLLMPSGTDQPYLQGGRSTGLLGFDQSPPLEIMAPSTSPAPKELRRIGKVRMTWEESVSLWTEEEGEHLKGRLNLQASNFLKADELSYFDDSMVACALESFTDGPLKGLSVDKFEAGQHLKVLGRRMPTAPPPAGSFERLPAETPSRSTPTWEISDPTDYYLNCLRALPLSLPSLYELSWHVQEPPAEDLRFPLRKDLYRDLPSGKELFTTTSNDPLLDSRSFTVDLLSPLVRPSPLLTATPTSRDSFIGLWDDCINRLVSRFCPLQMNLLRKPESCDSWPNVTGLVNNTCLWRGEETHKLRPAHDPASSIVEKAFWSYSDLPYVLGYHAVGHVVTFCALSQSPEDSSIIRTNIYSLDLSNPSDRIKALVPCWRIACLLPLLAERSTKFSDFSRVDNGLGHVASEMTPRTVTRFYSGREKWCAVKEVYDVLDRQVVYTEHASGWSEEELSITFTPRGFKAKPATAEELVEALKHVTKALVALHDLSFMHRDLSWEKVLKRCDKEEEWVVCGFEEMVPAPQINNPMAPGSGSGSRAPEIGRPSGVHGVKVDVWGVGYLMRTSGIGGGMLPKRLKELEKRCLDQNPEQRPTAADCYHHLLQFQTAVGDSYAC